MAPGILAPYGHDGMHRTYASMALFVTLESTFNAWSIHHLNCNLLHKHVHGLCIETGRLRMLLHVGHVDFNCPYAGTLQFMISTYIFVATMRYNECVLTT